MKSPDSPSQPNGDPSRDSLLDHQVFGFLDRIIPFLDDISIVVLCLIGTLTILGMLGLTRGSLILFWVGLLERWLGWGAIVVPILIFLGVLILYLRRKSQPMPFPWLEIIALELGFFVILGVLTILDGLSLTRAEVGEGGGVVGWGIATALSPLGSLGRIILLLLVLLLVLGFILRRILPRLSLLLNTYTADRSAIPSELPYAQTTDLTKVEKDEAATKKAKVRRVPREYRKNFRLPDQAEKKPSGKLTRDELLPPLSILRVDSGSKVTEKEINLSAGLIEKTLGDFGIPAKVVDFRTGPSVTQFAVEPGYSEQVNQDGTSKRNKVRVSQISALANDLALALSASALRIEAPVPGKSYVGIEVPNRLQATVRLRPVLESDEFQRINSNMAIGFGRDVAGAPVAADLSSMPHLLIAGTTGSGKSVCITSITACLAMNNTPEEVRLVLVDPKMVELIRFNGLPHLYGKVETDLERITGVLRWCTLEMDRRYILLQEERARDLENYNRKVRNKKGKQPLPRIVVMIDELADLMLLAPDQTERTLVRLAQMARATGIHLVVATQRPSTDILTGLIKANFPGRVSFAVASGVDSRVILDGPGAETLLGRGDMLYLAPEAAGPVRLQGVFVDDQEIEKIIHYWKSNWEVEIEQPEEPPWDELLARQAALGERDQVLEQAIEIVRQSGEASASMLQRRLRIGYPRAARLMDELEELGVVGESRSGGKTREVLIKEDDDPLFKTKEDSE